MYQRDPDEWVQQEIIAHLLAIQQRTLRSDQRLAAIERWLVSDDRQLTQMRTNIMGELQDLQAAVKALVTEDSVIMAEMDRLQGLGSGVSAADVAESTAVIRGEVAKLAEEVAKVDPAAASAAAPVNPADSSAPADSSTAPANPPTAPADSPAATAEPPTPTV